MSNELEKAAADASAALGMSVEVLEGDPDVPLYNIEIWDAMDADVTNGPSILLAGRTHPEALAYLQGLETGARIQRERYAALVETVAALGRTVEKGNGDEVVPVSIGLHIIALRNTLKKLEAAK